MAGGQGRLAWSRRPQRVMSAPSSAPEDLDITSPRGSGRNRGDRSLSRHGLSDDCRNAPDYAYVAQEPDPGRFRLTPDVETLPKLNRYTLDRSNGVASR